MSAVIAASRAAVSMNNGSTWCTARYNGRAAALRPTPSYARASQYRNSLRCGTSERHRISAVASTGAAWPHRSSRTRAIPANRLASTPRTGSSRSELVRRINSSQSLTR